MLFSERLELQNEYEQWLEDVLVKEGFKVKPCVMSMITFLEQKGLIKKGDCK
jgi:hypothetical protein